MNFSAGKFCAGITGWLRCKIIGVIVDKDCFANHILYRKPICHKYREGKSIVSDQRRQITGMEGMLTPVWIVMCHSSCKRVSHITAAVRSRGNMKAKIPFMAGTDALGEPFDLSADNDSLFCLEKLYRSCYSRISAAA